MAALTLAGQPRDATPRWELSASRHCPRESTIAIALVCSEPTLRHTLTEIVRPIVSRVVFDRPSCESLPATPRRRSPRADYARAVTDAADQARPRRSRSPAPSSPRVTLPCYCDALEFLHYQRQQRKVAFFSVFRKNEINY